jgi:hypothetical protein
MKMLLSALLIFSIALTASACALSDSGSGTLEDKYVAAIQQYLDVGNTEKAQGALKEALSKYPGSEKLFALQESMNGDETQTAEITSSSETADETQDMQETASASGMTSNSFAVPTEAQVKEQFLKMRALYRKWFTHESQFYNEMLKISIPNPDPDGFDQAVYAYKITDPQITTQAALRSEFLEYCTPDCYDSFAAGQSFEYCGKIYLTYATGSDGGLYVYPGEIGFVAEDREISVRKLSDDMFEVQYLQEVFFNDPAGVCEYDHCVQNYVRMENGYYFGPSARSKADVATQIRGRYVVATERSALNVHSIPSESKESIIGQLPKGTAVESSRASREWVAVTATVNGKEISGWVRTEYLQYIE